jgi:hypothetical protein
MDVDCFGFKKTWLGGKKKATGISEWLVHS